MNAEILSVGTELLLGQVINSDTAYVARALSSVGINVHLYRHRGGITPNACIRPWTDSLARCDLLGNDRRIGAHRR